MISITLGRGGVGSRQIIAVIYRGGPANNNNNVPCMLVKNHYKGGGYVK